MWKIHYCVVCVLCVCDMYIQRCRHAPEHTHIHILIHTLMYVKVEHYGMEPTCSRPKQT